MDKHLEYPASPGKDWTLFSGFGSFPCGKRASFLSLSYQEPWALGSLIRSRAHQMGQLSKGCLGQPQGPREALPRGLL